MKEQLVQAGVPSEKVFAQSNQSDERDDGGKQPANDSIELRRRSVVDQEARYRDEHQANSSVRLHRDE